MKNFYFNSSNETIYVKVQDIEFGIVKYLDLNIYKNIARSLITQESYLIISSKTMNKPIVVRIIMSKIIVKG